MEYFWRAKSGMKTPSDDLFRLIKSLDTQEKVYFKQFAARKGEHSNYVLLFDAIDGQNEYDEGMVRKSLKNEAFIKNLKQAKSYASEAILRSLQEYHSATSAGALLGNNIQQVEILVRKRLFGIAMKLIQKSEKIARENHKFYYLSILLSQKRTVLTSQADRQAISEYHETYYKEEVECFDLMRNHVEYIRLSMLIIRDSFTNYVIQDQKKNELRELLREPLLQDEKYALSLPAKIQFHRNLGNIHALLGNKENSIPHYSAIVRLMEENPLMLYSQIKSYLMGINNLMVLLKDLKSFREHNEHFEKAKGFIDGLPKKMLTNSVIEVFMMIYTNYISYLLDSLNIEKGIRMSEEISPSVRKHFAEGSYLVFNINLFLLYFYYGDYRKALRQLHHIEQSPGPAVMQDIFDQVRIFSMITHYELGNLNLLPALCKSAERYLSKNRDITRTEILLLRFFKRAKALQGTKERVIAFTELKQELRPALEKEDQFREFDLLSWCESKIQGKAFLEVVREKKGL